MQHKEKTDSAPQNSNVKEEIPGVNAGPSLLDYIVVIVKHKKMIFLTTFIAAMLTALYSLTLPNIYTAKGMILPGEDDNGMVTAMLSSSLGGLGGLTGGALGGTTRADLYVTMLKSETVKDPIIDDFKLMDIYKAKVRADAYKGLDGATLIAVGKKDGVISISVTNKDPQLAADLVNAYVEELGKFVAELSMTSAGKNRVFLEKSLVEANLDLANAEDKLKVFQTKNKSISVTDQAKASIEGVAQLRAQLALAEVQLGILQRRLTASSQEVKTAAATIVSLQGQIALLEGAGGASSSTIPSVGSVPQLGQDYVRLMREYKIQEMVLELLTKQFEMVKINEVKDISSFQVIQKAKVPERKSKPSRSKLVLGMTFFVGILMTGIAFLKEHNKKMQAEERERLEQFLVLLPKPIVWFWWRIMS